MILALVGLALSSPFFLAGCGASISSVCQQECDCAQKCDAKDVQQCEKEGEKEQELASKAGCSGEFDTVVSCVGGATCKDGHLDSETLCATEEEAYLKCTGQGVSD